MPTGDRYYGNGGVAGGQRLAGMESGQAIKPQFEHPPGAMISILGSRHPISVYGAAAEMVLIGCQKHSLRRWLKHADSVGRLVGYSDKEVAEYRVYLEAIEKILGARDVAPSQKEKSDE